jgi:shikimate dehydrogenase
MIDGDTAVVVVLGDPVRQVKAPGLLNAAFAREGLNAVLVPMHVPPDGLAALLAGLRGVGNLRGVLVTVPHKVAAGDLADHVSQAAQDAGSANALRLEPDGTWHAGNFDGAGFVAGLSAAGHTVRGRRAVLVGAGGAGGAIAAALLDGGVTDLSVADPDEERLTLLQDRLAPRWPGRVHCATRPDLSDADLAINATPLGLRPGDDLPFDPADLPQDAVVADIVMEPAMTRLLEAAAASGRGWHPGLPMLTHQIDCYLKFFGFMP